MVTKKPQGLELRSLITKVPTLGKGGSFKAKVVAFRLIPKSSRAVVAYGAHEGPLEGSKVIE